MAKAIARRAPIYATVRRRSGPSPTVIALKNKLAKARKRKSESKSVATMTVVTVAAAALGMGYLQAQGKLPATVMGVNAPLAIGAIGAFAVPAFVGGTVGRVASQVGLAALAVGAVQIGAGAPVIAGDGWVNPA